MQEGAPYAYPGRLPMVVAYNTHVHTYESMHTIMHYYLSLLLLWLRLILLLDDVLSELDSDRQTHLEQICEGSQVFFTTTHAEHFANFFGEVQRVEIV